MKTWQEFCESRWNNVDVVRGALADLGHMLDIPDEDELMKTVSQCSYEQILGYVQEYGLAPKSISAERFAAMLKTYAKGNVLVGGNMYLHQSDKAGYQPYVPD